MGRGEGGGGKKGKKSQSNGVASVTSAKNPASAEG